MKCAACIELLSSLATGETGGEAASRAREHLRGCASCARAWDETVATIALLRRMGDEEPPPDFGPTLHARLVAAGPPPRRSWWGALAQRLQGAGRPLAFAGVGALAVALAFGTQQRLARRRAAGEATIAATGPVVPIFRVPRSKLAVVRIDFVAEQPVDDVEFAITLPEGLHFVSDGQVLPQREFRWRGRLQQGSNPIPVAVRGDKAGRYTVAAHAFGADVDAKQKVLLEVVSS